MSLTYIDYGLFFLAMSCLIGIVLVGDRIDSGQKNTKEIKMSGLAASAVFGTLAQFLLPIAEQELPILVGALESQLNNLLAQHGHSVKITPVTPPDSVLPPHKP